MRDPFSVAGPPGPRLSFDSCIVFMDAPTSPVFSAQGLVADGSLDRGFPKGPGKWAGGVAIKGPPVPIVPLNFLV